MTNDPARPTREEICQAVRSSVAESLAGPQTLMGPMIHSACVESWDEEVGKGDERRDRVDGVPHEQADGGGARHEFTAGRLAHAFAPAFTFCRHGPPQPSQQVGRTYQFAAWTVPQRVSR